MTENVTTESTGFCELLLPMKNWFKINLTTSAQKTQRRIYVLRTENFVSLIEFTAKIFDANQNNATFTSSQN